MIPLALACLKGAKLTMLGSPVNVIAATQAEEFGAGHIGFFAWSVLGIPQLIGSIIIVIFLGKRLLPERQSKSIPADFSGHAHTLVQHYNLEPGCTSWRCPPPRPSSVRRARPSTSERTPVCAQSPSSIRGDQPLKRDRLEAGDLILVRGDGHEVERLAADLQVEVREHGDKAALGDVLLSRTPGWPRSSSPSGRR